MIRQKNGKCKLFESDGTTFICDARYRINSYTDSSGYQDNTGALYDIDRSTLPSLNGQEGILKLEDGQSLDFAARGLDMMMERLDIRINTAIKI
ncbi:MAG: hypothetical protein BMS9Abin02_2005 [Anaerolineae bacterium]|nr:MAG: hypothetical protein BMS9Abin02_2005 [Anaerolineae bacterium]